MKYTWIGGHFRLKDGAKSEMLEALKAASATIVPNIGDSIYQRTMIELKKAATLTVEMPMISAFSPLDSIKKIPRNGKLIALNELDIPDIKPRTVYDHVISVAHLADALLLPDNERHIKDSDFAPLARIIAYHELNEALLGDAHIHTEIDEDTARSVIGNRLAKLSFQERDAVTNRFLWMYANSDQRTALSCLNSHMLNSSDNVSAYFRMLERLDPTIAVWRYAFRYRHTLQAYIEKFTSAMDSFLTYEKILDYRNLEDFTYLTEIIDIICAPEKIKRYISSGKPVADFAKTLTTAKILTYLIEEVPLFFD